MGFQHMRPIIHEAASRKGGKIKVVKGLGRLSEEQRKEIASKGGIAKRDNQRRNGAEQTQGDPGDNSAILERILGAIDEQVQE